MTDSSQADSDDENLEDTKEKCIPHVVILEQPTNEAIRFRYTRENRNGSIPGIRSTRRNKTYPTIKIMNYDGPATVIVSCVTINKPYMPHPYKLVGKHCNQGICTIHTNDVCKAHRYYKMEKNVIVFSDINIECITRKDVKDSLDLRQKLRVDPFQTGFEHKNNKYGINFSAIRLCFQVFVEGSQKDKFNVPLMPIVSNPIYDRKMYANLIIRELCQCSATVAGGTNIILLCEKVLKDDIQIKFFEERNGVESWEGYGVFDPSDIHKQTAISFKTPKFYKQDLEKPIQVYIQLRRPSDGSTSEPLPFQMLPLFATDPNALRRKRKRLNGKSGEIFFPQTQISTSEYPTFANDNNNNNNNNNNEFDNNCQWNSQYNMDIFAKNSTLQPLDSSVESKPFIQKHSDIQSFKQEPLSDFSHNEHLMKQYNSHVVEMKDEKWNLTENDQYNLCMSNQSQLHQPERDTLTTLMNNTMPECQYKKQLMMANNNMTTNVPILTDASNTNNFMNSNNFNKEQMSFFDIIKSMEDDENMIDNK